MNFSRIVFLLVFCFCSTSCQDGTKEKSGSEKKEIQATPKESRKTEKSFPKLDLQKPTKKSLDKDMKKKKRKALDTLKPVVAAP